MSSVCYCCKNTRLTNDKSDYNTRYFASRAAQLAYFESKVISGMVFTNQMFIRENKGSVVLGAPFMNLNHCDYLFFNNTSYGDRWYYCFVTKVEYVSDKATEVFFEVDMFQTWFLDLTLKPCMIEREIVLNDTIGSNLIDEGINTGEYMIKTLVNTDTFDDLCFVVALPSTQTYQGQLLGRMYNGLRLYAFKSTEIGAMNDMLATSPNVVAVFVLPIGCFVDPNNIPLGDVGEALRNCTELRIDETTVSFTHSTFGSYTPKNNKLHAYPYEFVTVDNNSGGAKIYRFENFSSVGDSTQAMTFATGGDIYPDGDLFIYPKNYKGMPSNWIEKLTLGGCPLCAFTVDSFYSWYAQNKNRFENSMLMATVNAGASAATLSPSFPSAFGQLTQQIATIADMREMPDTSKGSITGSLAVNMDKLKFTIIHNLIKEEYARIIDDYFTLYGYRILEIKTPALTGRPNWNYVKTNGFMASGAIPNVAMQEIKALFDTGVRVWHTDDIGNYELNNSL